MLISKVLVRLIGLVTDIIVGLLGLRILLKLLGASTVAPFVTWVYETTKPLLTPFQGMFPSPDLAPRLTLEFSAIFAIIAYSFIGYLITDIIRIMDLRAEGSSKKK
jgi:uncharacterized protein YggT (Ycf19 family)